MLRNRLLAISTVAVGLTGVAHAQKFAIIDMQKAVLATSDGKKASQAINDKFAPVKAAIDKLAADITAKQNDFSKNRATMTPTQVNTAQSELENLTTALKRKQEDAQQDLDDEENKQLGSIVPKLQQVINEYAAANQITIVLDSSAAQNNMIYGDGSLNIISPIVLAYEKGSGGAAAAPAGAAPKAPATSAPKAPAATTNNTAAPGTTTVPRKQPATTTPAPKTAAPAK